LRFRRENAKNCFDRREKTVKRKREKEREREIERNRMKREEDIDGD